eukprot:1182228-Rhodomonas_salina.5
MGRRPKREEGREVGEKREEGGWEARSKGWRKRGRDGSVRIEWRERERGRSGDKEAEKALGWQVRREGEGGGWMKRKGSQQGARKEMEREKEREVREGRRECGRESGREGERESRGERGGHKAEDGGAVEFWEAELAGALDAAPNQLPQTTPHTQYTAMSVTAPSPAQPTCIRR